MFQFLKLAASIIFFYNVICLAASHVVVMKSISFAPVKLEIKSGDTVEWVNQSYTEHSATSDNQPAAFDTGRIKPKAHSKNIVFNEPGNYPYRCTVHGKTMSAEIVVVPK